MEIKTFTACRINGDRNALAILDKEVKEALGTNVSIHSVTDAAYGSDQTGRPAENFIMSRVVVYSSKKKS